MKKNAQRAVLVIFDGWGIRLEKKDNAIAQAKTPHYLSLLRDFPNGALEASGLPVGLPEGVMGNSEVGHMNIGSGRRVVQDQVRIHEAIDSGEFGKNRAFLSAFDVARKNGRLHLLGLVSQGNVHSAERHYLELISLSRREGVSADRLFVHAILDGRDTPPKSAETYLSTLENHLKKMGGRIASISGRFFTMDRDKRWERTDQAYRTIVLGDGSSSDNALSALRAAYQRGETDEFVTPTLMSSTHGEIHSGDAVLCFNFRPDRMRQIVRALTHNDAPISSLDATRKISVTCMTTYDSTFHLPVAFPPVNLQRCLGEIISLEKDRQFRTAETEKYAHVTYFFNGGRETPFDGEERLLVPSPKVKTYDLQPEMSSVAVTDAVLKHLEKGEEALIVVNFAQPDMVGHTGVFDAAVAAVEAGDRSIGQIREAAFDSGFSLYLTADHGNVEMMRDPKTGQPHTAHTLNPVPFICTDPAWKGKGTMASGGSLRDIAPTILHILGIEKPAEMDGNNLLLF